jgi:SAM-dependent methyltransferase
VERISALSDVSRAYLSALSGEPVWARTSDGDRVRLPVRQWLGFGDDGHTADAALIGHSDGPTLDIGCGPGRLVAALLARGVPALGIDTDAAAIALSRWRGAPAIRRDAFGPVPGQGRWRCALLADGNIGIGGDPARLLRRVRELLAPDGVAVVEFASAGAGLQVLRIRLETTGWAGNWFSWAQVGVDAAAAVAVEAGLRVLDVDSVNGRHIGLLARDGIHVHLKVLQHSQSRIPLDPADSGSAP